MYRLIDIDDLGVRPEAVGDLVRAARDLGFDGLNITHPCKQLVIEHLDGLAPQAAALGAVNTVVFEDGRAVGHNTDVTGFAASFARGLPDAPLEQVVQLGAGGAGAAVAHAMLTLGAGAGHRRRRDARPGRRPRRPPSTGTSAPGGPTAATPDALPALLGRPTASCTPPPPGWPRTPACPSPRSCCIPACGSPRWSTGRLETELLRVARGLGCATLDGGGMAVFQAADAFRLFTGREPDSTRMLADIARAGRRRRVPN